MHAVKESKEGHKETLKACKCPTASSDMKCLYWYRVDYALESARHYDFPVMNSEA